MKIIELYGAPGSTKSTTAAEQYAKYSRQGIKAALVVEKAKNLCERQYKFDFLDQISFLGGQCEWELDKIRAGYNLIFTDCPWALTTFYASYSSKNFFYGDQLYWAGKEWERQVQSKYPDIIRERYFLKVNQKNHTNLGRIHSLEDSIDIEYQLKDFMLKHEICFSYWKDDLIDSTIPSI